MADSISSSKTVSMTIEFSDGDTRTLTQNNPLTNADSLVAAINDFDAYCKANSILVGDSASGSYMRMKEAKIINRTTTNFDLGLS